MDVTVEAQGLTKAFGNNRVLDQVDLTVRAGSVFALLGPNGAGKTTLVRILATLVKPDGGEATVGGHDVVRDRHTVRRLISLTGQYAALDELQTGAENLRMMARLHGLSGARMRTTMGQLLDRFDLAESAHKRVDTYSGGMKRRLDLAMSLTGAPAVLFLDEPTTGLDLPSRQAMWRVVTDLATSGVTVFLTTQYLEEADQLADRIAVLDRGQIVAHGSADELKARVADQRLDITAVDRSAYDQIVWHLGDTATDADPARLTVGVATDGTATHVRSTLDAIDPGRRVVARFAVRAATLDDVFLALTGTTHHTEPAHV